MQQWYQPDGVSRQSVHVDLDVGADPLVRQELTGDHLENLFIKIKRLKVALSHVSASGTQFQLSLSQNENRHVDPLQCSQETTASI